MGEYRIKEGWSCYRERLGETYAYRRSKDPSWLINLERIVFLLKGDAAITPRTWILASGLVIHYIRHAYWLHSTCCNGARYFYSINAEAYRLPWTSL